MSPKKCRDNVLHPPSKRCIIKLTTRHSPITKSVTNTHGTPTQKPSNIVKFTENRRVPFASSRTQKMGCGSSKHIGNRVLYRHSQRKWDMSHPKKMGYTTSTETSAYRKRLPYPLQPYLIPPRELADARWSFRYKAVGVLFRDGLFVCVLVFVWQWRESHALAWLGLHSRPVNRCIWQMTVMVSKCLIFAEHSPNYRNYTYSNIFVIHKHEYLNICLWINFSLTIKENKK